MFMDMMHLRFIRSKSDVRVFSLRRLNIYGQSVLVASTDYFATFSSMCTRNINVHVLPIQIRF